MIGSLDPEDDGVEVLEAIGPEPMPEPPAVWKVLDVLDADLMALLVLSIKKFAAQHGLSDEQRRQMTHVVLTHPLDVEPQYDAQGRLEGHLLDGTPGHVGGLVREVLEQFVNTQDIELPRDQPFRLI